MPPRSWRHVHFRRNMIRINTDSDAILTGCLARFSINCQMRKIAASVSNLATQLFPCTRRTACGDAGVSAHSQKSTQPPAQPASSCAPTPQRTMDCCSAFAQTPGCPEDGPKLYLIVQPEVTRLAVRSPLVSRMRADANPVLDFNLW